MGWILPKRIKKYEPRAQKKRKIEDLEND